MNAKMNKGLVCSAVLASIGTGLLSQAAMADGPVVYSQLLPSYAGGFFADGVAGQYYSERLADDFTLGSATSVNGVIWAGSSEGFYYSDLTNFNSFRISIFSDAGGLPGAVLLDTTVGIGATNPTYVGYSFTPVYEFSVKFNNLNLAAGTYWVSIGSINNQAFGDGFVWETGATANNHIAADFFDGGGFQGFDGFGDFAFAIQGAAAPAPGAMALLGVAGVLGGRRRRSN